MRMRAHTFKVIATRLFSGEVIKSWAQRRETRRNRPDFGTYHEESGIFTIKKNGLYLIYSQVKRSNAAKIPILTKALVIFGSFDFGDVGADLKIISHLP